MWIREKLNEVKFGKCENCGKECMREFAHKKPTDLSGNSRGRKERYYDYINNKDC